jgi:uncharacterized protein YkwD
VTIKKAINKARNDWLLNASVIACILSLGVFLYFLIGTSQRQNQVRASSYSSEQVISSVNRRRKENNLDSLSPNQKLQLAAQSKADHMQEKGYFSHIYAQDGTKWSDFIKQKEYDYLVAGENLANGFYDVDSMVEAWMNSPTHRENILNPKVDETGLGISYGELNGSPTIFVVQMFGKLNKEE